MNAETDRRDTKEVLNDARREGNVPVSPVSLKVVVLIFCLAYGVYLAPLFVTFLQSVLSEGTLDDGRLESLLHGSGLGASALFFVLATVSAVLLAGLLQTRFFFAFDSIVPQAPKLGEPFTLSRAAVRLGLYLLYAVLTAGIAALAVEHLAPLFLSAATADSSGVALAKLLKRILLTGCLAGVGVITLSVVLHRALFIFRHR